MKNKMKIIEIIRLKTTTKGKNNRKLRIVCIYLVNNTVSKFN